MEIDRFSADDSGGNCDCHVEERPETEAWRTEAQNQSIAFPSDCLRQSSKWPFRTNLMLSSWMKTWRNRVRKHNGCTTISARSSQRLPRAPWKLRYKRLDFSLAHLIPSIAGTSLSPTSWLSIRTFIRYGLWCLLKIRLSHPRVSFTNLTAMIWSKPPSQAITSSKYPT